MGLDLEKGTSRRMYVNVMLGTSKRQQTQGKVRRTIARSEETDAECDLGCAE